MIGTSGTDRDKGDDVPVAKRSQAGRDGTTPYRGVPAVPVAPPHVLRDLPGVPAFEQRLADIQAHPFPRWAAGCDDLGEDADELTRSLFALDHVHTLFFSDFDWENAEGEPEDIEREAEQWEQNFALLGDWAYAWTIDASFTDWTLPDEESALVVFDAMGWDVRGPDGHALRCLALIGRQLICVAKGLRGELGTGGRHVSLKDLASWEASLAEEAERFQRKARIARRAA